MAYDEHLANRVRECLAGEQAGAVSERPMFGGLAFLLGGNMSVAVSHQGGLLVRVPPGEVDKALSRPHTEQMVMAGRPAQGWIRVSNEGLRTARQMAFWVKLGTDFARSLPAKSANKVPSPNAARPTKGRNLPGRKPPE